MGIIQTKLNRPAVAVGFIPRPQLDKLMGQCRHTPLTLVTAPAGYGKSSLVSDWMQRFGAPNAWLSIDENDNDFGVFLSHLLAAIEGMFPGALRQTSARIDAPVLPVIPVVATSLINELSHIDQTFFLVLDDFHLVGEESVHELLGELLRHPPAGMHLVIISRCRVPLPFTAYRARGQLTEIGLQELRFTTPETAVCLSQILDSEVAPSVATAWQEKTEGWVTGLRLAALAMRQKDESSDFPPADLRNPHFVREYFYAEVFSKQPPQIQRGLLLTAILDRFDARLSEAVALADGGDSVGLNGWEFVAQLKKGNLFLVAVDEENGWYRYHHLFKAFLVNLLTRHCDRAKIILAHQRASDWLAGQGLYDEAILHALAIEDTKRAVALVVMGGFQRLDEQDWPRLEHWLSLLPGDVVEQDPELLILKAWLLHSQFNLADVSLCLRKMEAIKSSPLSNTQAEFENVQGHYLALLGYESYLKTDGKTALQYAQLACQNIPSHHKRARAFAEIVRAEAYQMVGDLRTGLDRYLECMKALSLLDEKYQHLLQAKLCSLYWMEADLTALRQTAECSLTADRGKLLPEAAASGHYFLGIACYGLNDLDRAEETLSAVTEGPCRYSTEILAFSSLVLAIVYQAMGKPAMARKSCEAIAASGRQANHVLLIQLAQWFSAELAIRQGRFAEALQWAKQFRHEPSFSTYQFYLPQLTIAKVLLAQDTVKSRQQAIGLLNELHSFLRNIHNKVFQIDVLALQALLQEAQGNQAAAQEKLDHALRLAEPGGWIRPFLDLGSSMKDLLVQIHRQGRHQQYIARILAAFGTKGYPLYARSSEQDIPCALLTNREIDILQLAGKRLRDKEIAEELSISPDTVKAHLRNVRKKMNVNSRMDAVAKAIDLNLLPPI